ncbi:hypothetical protein Alches_16990 [Alicyclobacillus hesperidum subsp. aegles]|uniref:hypothetical protein n=1 Tax=Alicyclobacillus hesperidum TaxID=89784 RepID=UPI0007190A95|nr:hypothetical protein [Alicyclobacillus hesperidum]GLG01659.1 hypothetical protein Alches_16990 [Alicyclobacillus hesperidum subsp. aegles]
MASSRWRMLMAAGLCAAMLTGCANEHAVSPENAKQHGIQSHNGANAATSTPAGSPSITSKPLPAGVTNVQQLAYQLRGELLKQISNPAQGQVCLDNACTTAVTSFTGPSSENPKDTLTMAFYQMKTGWYVLVAPTVGNALATAQQIAKAHLAFPSQSGVLVVRDGEMEWYWLTQGREWTKRQPFVSR